MELSKIRREALYEQVWKEPMTEVAKNYHVSSSYLARVCRMLNVPRPERGYWAKVAAGKSVPVPPLPEATVNRSMIWSESGTRGPRQKLAPQNSPSESRPPGSRNSPKHLPSTHPLISGARELFVKGRKTGNGYLKPHKRNLVDIVTSMRSLDAALSIANTVFLEFEARSWAVKLEATHQQFHRPEVDDRPVPGKPRYDVNHWSPGRSTIVYLGSIALGITLIEESERTEMAYIGGDYVPTKNLSKSKLASTWTTHQDLPTCKFRLRIYTVNYRSSWLQEWSIKLEDDVVKFAQKIARELHKATGEIAEEYLRVEAIILKEQDEWEQRKEKWRIEEAKRLRKQSVEKSTEALESMISDWMRAKMIHDFFGEIETAIECSPEDQKDILRGRLASAREFVEAPDVLDALKGWKTPDELYGEKNRIA